MSNLSKIILIIFIVLGLWWGYDSFFSHKNTTDTEIDKTEITVKDNTELKLPEKNEIQQDKKEENVFVYFLSSDKNGNQFLKPVLRSLPSENDRLEYSIKQLLSGPNVFENSAGVYTEIPKETKLNRINHLKDKIIVDLTSNFGVGGGSDSIYSRMRQLIKTALVNTDKPVYLYLDGKQADILGGEGITFSQPLSENSLDE